VLVGWGGPGHRGPTGRPPGRDRRRCGVGSRPGLV